MTAPQPHRHDFPSHDAYLLAWYTSGATERDGRLTSDETGAKFAVICERLAEACRERD